MRKLIGTIAILIFLYLGFVGSEEHNISPFIKNWFETKSEQNIDTLKNANKDVSDTLNIKDDEVVR